MATKAIFVLLSSFLLFFFSNFSVQSRVNGGAAYAVAQVAGNPCLWAAAWNASSPAESEQAIEVWDSTGTRAPGNFITGSEKPQEQPRVHSSELIAGKYQTAKNKGIPVTKFVPTNDFEQGKAVVFRVRIADAKSGLPVANATAEIFVSGAQSGLVVCGPSNSEGIAEAKWKPSAPNKRKGKTHKGGAGGIQTGSYPGGIQTGSYKGTLTKISASGYLWDGESRTVNFRVLPK